MTPDYYDLTPLRSFFAAREPGSTFIIIEDHPIAALGMEMMLRKICEGAIVLVASSHAQARELIEKQLALGCLDLIVTDLNLPDVSNLDGLKALRSLYPHVCVAVSSAESDHATILGCLDSGAVGYIPKSATPSVTEQALQMMLSGNIYIPPEALKGLSEPQHYVLEEPTPHGVGKPANPFSTLYSVSSKNYLKTIADSTLRNLATNAAQPSDADLSNVKKLLFCATQTDNANNANNVLTGFEIGLTGRQVDVLDLILLGMSNKRICRELNLAEGTVKVHVSAVLRALGAKNRTQAVVAASNLGLRSGALKHA